MKILITGHSGFVGRHFWRALDQPGNELTGVDIAAPRTPVLGCDQLVRNDRRQDVRDFFRTDTTRYDLVIHLAAVVGGRATIEGSPLKVAVDLAIDSELFQWALRTRPGRIVYYSSSAAYPIHLQTTLQPRKVDMGDGPVVADLPNQHRLTETDLDLTSVGLLGVPDLTYGWSKLMGEMLAMHAEDAGLRVHVFRPFSGYGEDQGLDYPFPAFIRRALQRDDPFQVWGGGMQVRDFIHIDDVVAGTLAAVDQDVPGPVNLCTGRAMSFNNLAELVTSAAGYHPRIGHQFGAPTGVGWRVGDPAKMETFYKPQVELEEGIRRALAG